MGAERYGIRLRGPGRSSAPGGGRRGGGAGRLVVLVCAAMLLAGCASMPSGGEVRRIDASPRADADAQVRVFGVPPRRGERPTQIVRGFLEATTSDEARFSTARLYLTEQARKSWKPFSLTTVLEDGPIPRRQRPRGDPDENGLIVELSGRKVATVDRNQAYRPDDGRFQKTVHLAKENGEWRIDSPPEGLLLGKSDFERIYRSVNTYYFAEPQVDTKGAGKHVLVSDPVYLRKRIDPVTTTVKALLRGPTDWLEPVAGTAFPTGTRLIGNSLALDDSNGLRVRLNERGSRVGTAQCTRMAAQVMFTVQELAPAKVGRVELERSTGSRLCALTSGRAEAFAPAGLGDTSKRQYFIDAQQRMAALADVGSDTMLVDGPFGHGAVPLRSVGVDRSERMAAGVSADGQSLYVARMKKGAARGPVRLHSAAQGAESGLAAPSWDGNGDLWVADRDPARPRLLRIPGGTGEPQEVAVPSLGDAEIRSLRVASDGLRIALLVSRDGRQSLELGRVERSSEGENPSLAVNELHSVTPWMEHVEAASWAGASRLVVVGREPGGVQQLQYVETDGSATNTPALPGINGVKAVAASEDPDKPLIADSADGIVRLPVDANWRLVVKRGTAPVYPG